MPELSAEFFNSISTTRLNHTLSLDISIAVGSISTP